MSRFLKSVYELADAILAHDSPALIILGVEKHAPTLQAIEIANKIAVNPSGERARVFIAELENFYYSRTLLNITHVPTVFVIRNKLVLSAFPFQDAKAFILKARDLLFGEIVPADEAGAVINLALSSIFKQVELRVMNDIAEQPIVLGTMNKEKASSFPPGTKVVKDPEAIEAICRRFAIPERSEFVLVNGNEFHTAVDITEFSDCPSVKQAAQAALNQLDKYVHEQVNKHHVVVFMKGSKSAPFCRYSKAIVALLNEENIDFDFFDVLNDSAVRERVKVLNNWPTFPQVYVGGTLIGGNDTIKDMHDEGMTYREIFELV